MSYLLLYIIFWLLTMVLFLSWREGVIFQALFEDIILCWAHRTVYSSRE